LENSQGGAESRMQKEEAFFAALICYDKD